jgi:hypothetical protein
MNKIILIILLFSILIYRAKNKKINKFCNKNKFKQIRFKAFLADKILVKDYVKKNFDYINVAKTLFKTNKPLDLFNYNFPKNFVLKCNEGSSKTMIVKNNNYNIYNLIINSLVFLNLDKQFLLHLFSKEAHYKLIDKSIFIEEYLGDNIKEFKIHLFNGNIGFISNIHTWGYTIWTGKNPKFDDQLCYIKDSTTNFSKKTININKPKHFNLMKKFCYDFYEKTKINYVRVDVSEINDKLYFGEFTFTPHGCMEPFSFYLDKLIYNKYIKSTNNT